MELTLLLVTRYFPSFTEPVAASRPRLKRYGTRAEIRFRLSAKRKIPFKSAGGVSSVDYWQPSCSSNAGYTVFGGSVKSTGYPLHSTVSPSLPLPCVTVCHHVATGLYYRRSRRLDLSQLEPVKNFTTCFFANHSNAYAYSVSRWQGTRKAKVKLYHVTKTKKEMSGFISKSDIRHLSLTTETSTAALHSRPASAPISRE